MWIKTEDNEYVRQSDVEAVLIKYGRPSDKGDGGQPEGITFRVDGTMDYTAPIPKEKGLPFMERVLQRVLEEIKNATYTCEKDREYIDVSEIAKMSEDK